MLYFHSFSRNVNRGHGNPLNQTFAVQTPPVGIRLDLNGVRGPVLYDKMHILLSPPAQVSAFPGETFQVGIFATDELNVPTTSVVRFLDDSTTSITGTTEVLQPVCIADICKSSKLLKFQNGMLNSNTSSQLTCPLGPGFTGCVLLYSQNIELYRLTPATASLQQVSPCFSLPVSYSVQTNSSSEFPREDISVRTVAAVNNMVNTATFFRLNPLGCPPGVCVCVYVCLIVPPRWCGYMCVCL